jgi:hypothetical protein
MKKVLFLIMATAAFPSYADNSQSAVFPRDAVVYGNTYGNWSAAWRQWADAMPAKKHPLFDTADCSEGQSGPVWFLGGRFCSDQLKNCNSAPAIRTCTVPAGKALYFPVVNSACLDGEAKNNLCITAKPFITEIKQVINDQINQTTDLQVTLDNVTVKNDYLKTNFRVQSPVYSTVLPDGNFYQALGEPVITPGTYLGMDDGVYLMLAPLSKGTHKLNIKGYFPQWDFRLDFNYKLIIQ